MEREMHSVLSLLNEIRGKESMYCGKPNITRLAMFLRGYAFAKLLEGETEPHLFLQAFQLFTESRFSIKISRSWDEIIGFHSTDDLESILLFWKCYDEYTVANAEL
jgi:hypothetical protein